jgi:hypothetical protein
VAGHILQRPSMHAAEEGVAGKEIVGVGEQNYFVAGQLRRSKLECRKYTETKRNVPRAARIELMLC